MIKRQFDWTSCRCLLNTLQLRTSGLTCLVKYVWSAMNFVLCLGQQRNPWHGGKRWNPPSENVFDGLALPFYSISVIPGNPCHLKLCIVSVYIGFCLFDSASALSIYLYFRFGRLFGWMYVSLATCVSLWLPLCFLGYLFLSLSACVYFCLPVCLLGCLHVINMQGRVTSPFPRRFFFLPIMYGHCTH